MIGPNTLAEKVMFNPKKSAEFRLTLIGQPKLNGWNSYAERIMLMGDTKNEPEWRFVIIKKWIIFWYQIKMISVYSLDILILYSAYKLLITVGCLKVAQ